MPKRRMIEKRRRQIRDMDSSQSYSLNNQSDSWECPPSARKKFLYSDSALVSARRASLRSAKKAIENTTPYMKDNQVPDYTVIYAHCASLTPTNEFNETRTTSVLASQVPECSAAELESSPREVVHSSTFAQEIRHEENEKIVESVAPENWSVDVAKMEQVREADNFMVNHTIQMEKHNAFEAVIIPVEQEPLGEDVQASNDSMERVHKKNGKCIAVVEHASSGFSLNLTEMVDTLENDGDEVNFFGRSSPMDTIEGYCVKPKFMLILKRILSKHGDVFENSLVSTMTIRSMFFEVICDIILQLQDKYLHKITENELHNMIGLANEIKNMKVNIEWLYLRLKEILEARHILKQSGILKEERDRNKKFIESVQKELECCEEEKRALEEKLQQLRNRIHDKETACKKTLTKARDESTIIYQTITTAKSKLRRFFYCSLVDDLL